MDDDDVDGLYALPLDEFVAARNRLAKERKDPSLRKLRKPSVAAWHVNRLARGEGGGVRAVVDAASLVRAAQQRAVSGARTGGSDLRAASRAHRDAIEGLVAEVPGTVAERVRSTLTAASLDEELVPLLLAGRLVDDLEPAGFGDLGGLDLVAFDEEPEEAPEADPRAEEREAATRALEAARQELRDARAREAEARAAMDRAYDAVRDAERAVADAEARLAALD